MLNLYIIALSVIHIGTRPSLITTEAHICTLYSYDSVAKLVLVCHLGPQTLKMYFHIPKFFQGIT